MDEGTPAGEPAPEIQFGIRHCEICHEIKYAPVFSQHVLEHPVEELIAKWPGGLPGLLNSLSDSLAESAKRAEGHPEVIANLKASSNAIGRFLQRFQAT